MAQTKLFSIALKPEAEKLYTVLEDMFEADGLPLSLFEVDEATQTFEVALYIEGPTETFETRIAQRLSQEALNISFEHEVMPDIDWVTHVLSELKPIRCGRFLIHGAHDRQQVRPTDFDIEIEAGQAFGTGHHDTTLGCLELITRQSRVRQPQRVLDLGTGSAILAMAIAKAYKTPVLATDIDPVAVRVANSNIALNRLSNLINAVTARGFSHPAIRHGSPFDLIVANILAGPLIKLAPAMRRYTTPSGELILSGILASQRRQVIAAYTGQNFRHLETIWRGEWIAMRLQKRNSLKE